MPSSFLINPEDLQRIFKKLDKNGDGLITVQQLKSLLDNIGCTTTTTTLQDLQLLVGGSSAAVTGSLDSIDFFFFYNYFVNNNINKTKEEEEEEEKEGMLRSDDDDGDLREAFKVFDLNGDGFISGDELRIVLFKFGLLWDDDDRRRHGDDSCGNMIRMYDTNSDGLLDFEEFKKMMTTATVSADAGGG